MSEMKEWTLMVTPEEKLALQKLLGEMRAKAQSSQPQVCLNRKFLPSRTQMYYYKECVRAYYYEYIAGRVLKHKLLMLHYAAIYAVIAQGTGIRGGKFYGADFDRFMMDYCQIKYNESKDAKGRYRQVGDVYAKHFKQEGEEKMQECFECFMKNFSNYLQRPRGAVSYSKAVVPQMI